MAGPKTVALFLTVCCGLLLQSGDCGGAKELEEYFKWKQVAFASNHYDAEGIIFPYEYDRTGTDDRIFVAGNNVPMGAAHHRNRIFLTVPRRRPGIPSTLNYVFTKTMAGTASPLFIPFPNLQTNDLHPRLQPDANRIVSVYRTRVDDCDRLWFIDTGVLEYPNNRTYVQRPSIWIYDLDRDSLIRRFEIPAAIVANGNGLASITVDTDERNCNNTYAYIPDLAASQLHVYSLSQNRMWSFRHNYFHMDPHYGDFDVAGVQFQWDDGIFSITLGNRQPDGYRDVYFHPMISVSEFLVSSRVLQNEQSAARTNHGNDFKLIGQRGSNTQSTMHAFDRQSGAIFFAQIAVSGISCWNTATKLSPQTHEVLAQNNATMIYPSDLNIDREGTVWMFTNTMPRFIYASLNPNEYNFRLWRGSAADLIRASRCDVRSSTFPSNVYSGHLH